MKWDVFNFKVLLYVIGICKVCISVVFDEFYSTSPLFLVRCKKAIAANREKDILWLIFVCCTVLRCVFQLCIVSLMRMLNFYPINFIVFLNIFFALFLSLLRQGMYSVCLIWFFACYIVWWFRRDVLYAAISFCQWVFLIFVLNFYFIPILLFCQVAVDAVDAASTEANEVCRTPEKCIFT